MNVDHRNTGVDSLTGQYNEQIVELIFCPLYYPVRKTVHPCTEREITGVLFSFRCTFQKKREFSFVSHFLVFSCCLLSM